MVKCGTTTYTIQIAESGAYTVTVTNSTSCSNTRSVETTKTPLPNSILSNVETCKNGEVILNPGNFETYVWSNTATTSSITVNAGDYTVTLTDSNSCTSTSSIQVTENSTPSLSITGNLEYYTGFDTDLTTIGTGTYVWSTAATTASITINAGDYTVTLTDSNGCTAVSSVQVTENSTPSLSITDNLEYCTGFDTDLTAVGTGTYVWSNAETTASITVTAGDYTVTLTQLAQSMLQTIVDQ